MPWIIYEPIKVSFHATTQRTHETRVVIAFKPWFSRRCKVSGDTCADCQYWKGESHTNILSMGECS
jgi:hypothetical protein